MGLLREPESIDFVVDPRPLKDQEKKQIKAIIAHYKKTGEVKKMATPQKTKKARPFMRDLHHERLQLQQAKTSDNHSARTCDFAERPTQN